MRRALSLAARSLGETNPNPVVGCVIVRSGKVVGEAYHRRAGGPHAEAVALARAGSLARGATLYVNLEPCAHHGRTPPCAPAVARAGIRRVVAALRDPDPRVDGRGIALLHRAGIEVTVGVLQAEATGLNERFLLAARARRPYVTLKAALTLDGRLATARRESKWITSPSQRRDARRLRRLHDGVAVGIGTVLADDPTLLPTPRVRRPFLRVVFDSRLRIPAGSRLVRSARRWPVWVLAARGNASKRTRLERLGVTVIQHADRGGRRPSRMRRAAAYQVAFPVFSSSDERRSLEIRHNDDAMGFREEVLRNALVRCVHDLAEHNRRIVQPLRRLVLRRQQRRERHD